MGSFHIALGKCIFIIVSCIKSKATQTQEKLLFLVCPTRFCIIDVQLKVNMVQIEVIDINRTTINNYIFRA